MNKTRTPRLVSETLNLFSKRFKNTERSIITSITLLKIAQMMTCKRVKYKEFEKIDNPNYYTIVFLPSGGGKDRISNDLDDYVFKPFRNWFKENAEKYYAKKKLQIQEEYTDSKNKPIKALIKEAERAIRYPILEVVDGTQEGLFEDAKALQEAGFGAITYKMSEFGMFLETAQNIEKQFLGCLYEGYDGKVISKSIKYGKRESSIENMPVNCLLLSDPSLFTRGNLKHMFDLLLQTGLSRRCVISFQKPRKKEIEYNTDAAFEKEKQFYRDCEKLSEIFMTIFNKIPSNAVYVFTDSALKNVHYPYKVKMEELENETEDVLTKKEIQSRQHKAIKIACLYACLNHPTELVVNDEDMQQAIDTVEFISKDFKTFRNYKPKEDDAYDKLWEFFLENLGKGFTRTELVYNQFQNFGISRDKFKDRFDDYIDSIEEMAKDKGYILKVDSINRNSGTEYVLTKFESQDLSDGTPPLEDLI
ncbi:MAG: DUF3987 domain-containing protein [Acinetobacter sp.]|nr:DUF3987 domain-containing protein [Acinetobacter sp.]